MFIQCSTFISTVSYTWSWLIKITVNKVQLEKLTNTISGKMPQHPTSKMGMASSKASFKKGCDTNMNPVVKT